jgi:hypothetical protein
MERSKRKMLSDEAISQSSDMKCPEVLMDKDMSIKNHRICIVKANLGPANPKAPETIYWIIKSTKLNVSERAAREMLCSNCGHYWKTKFIDDCMKKYEQVTPPEVDSSWVNTNDSAGYCDKWDIPCTGSRTCDTWEPGGPITAALVAMGGIEEEEDD